MMIDGKEIIIGGINRLRSKDILSPVLIQEVPETDA